MYSQWWMSQRYFWAAHEGNVSWESGRWMFSTWLSSSDGQRTAGLRLSVSSGLEKWQDEGDVQPSSGVREDGNKSLFSNVSFVRLSSRVVTLRTTYRTLCFVHFPFWKPPALASLATNRWYCQTHRYRRGEEGLVTKEGGEITMNRFRKWLYKPKVSYPRFPRCVSAAVSRVLFTALKGASKTVDEWLASLIISYTVTHLLTLACVPDLCEPAALPLLLLMLLFSSASQG